MLLPEGPQYLRNILMGHFDKRETRQKSNHFLASENRNSIPPP